MTAVEWLKNNLLKNGYINRAYYNTDSLNHLEGLFDQALEMNEHEISEAYMDGQTESDLTGPEAGTIYYNQKYKQ
jgi:hypothetical protein